MSTLPEDRYEQTREFYRRQLELSFRYSRRFSEGNGLVAGKVVDTAEYDWVLRDCMPDSLEFARRLGEHAFVLLDPVAAGPWWRDLLNYERACFMQAATTVSGPPTNRPRRGISAMCINFSWDLPELIKRLESGQSIPEELRQPVTLVFSRGKDGRVFVAQVSSDIERVFRATNGLRTTDQIALIAGTSVEQATRILGSLTGIGAIVSAMSSARMIEEIEARDKRK